MPFYFKPTLGGSTSHRGFNDFRFRDDAVVYLNAEYRWEAFSGLDMALFSDWGNVASNVGQIKLYEVENAYGIGFRFNSHKAVSSGSTSAWRRRRTDVLQVQQGVLRPTSTAAAHLFWRRWALGGRASGLANGPKFFRDDPIARDPETRGRRAACAGRAQPAVRLHRELVPRRRREGRHPRGQRQHRSTRCRTRAGSPTASAASREIDRESLNGPDTGTGPRPGPWTIVVGQDGGHHAGIHDPRLDRPDLLHQVRSAVEPRDGERRRGHLDEVLSRASAITCRRTTCDGPPRTTRHRRGRRIEDDDGRQRRSSARISTSLLKRAARDADGSYRVLASKALEGTAGRPVSLLRHATRRSQRHLPARASPRAARPARVLRAWLNHDDSRSINTLDTLVDAGGRTIVRASPDRLRLDARQRHDAGAEQRAGNEFLWESRPTFITMLTLGFYVRPWIKVQYPDIPAVGRIESPTSARRTGSRSIRIRRSRTPGPRIASGPRASSPASPTRTSGRSSARRSSPITRATEYLTDTLLTRKGKVLRAG